MTGCSSHLYCEEGKEQVKGVIMSESELGHRDPEHTASHAAFS